jgi:uncharacterized protein (DUF4415 family)
MQQTIKTRSGRILILPTAQENAAINAGIAADPDTYELSDEEFRQLRPGRPLKPHPKISTTIRLDADVLTALKATGPGWQTRVNEIMREWLRQHQAA